MKVRASPGAVEFFRASLDPPVPLAHVFHSSHPIPSILDNNSKYDPLLLSFAFARDRPDGLEIFLEAVYPRRRRSTSSRLGPCTASCPNVSRFGSLESPCRTWAPANPGWRFRIVVSMRSEPVLSRTSLYDRGLYPVLSLRQKPIMRKCSLWWAVRRLLKSWERIVHVAHP